MSKQEKFGLAQQTTLVVKMANSGSTKALVVAALVSKGMSEKQAKITTDFISMNEDIMWRGKGAQNWREYMTASFRDEPDMSSVRFKEIFDTEFPQITEKRRVEYTRYYFEMMSDLRKMPYEPTT